jgi:NAD(P)-dependent dehydrogenase (short-subunit alcohol dehydrogenase family)
MQKQHRHFLKEESRRQNEKQPFTRRIQMKRYEDKKVVIIGGTSGMGLATSKMLLDGGARVLVTGRSKEGLESAQKELGNDAMVVSIDARSLTGLDTLASRVKAEFDTSTCCSSMPGSAPERLSRASPRPSTTRCST